MNDSRRTVAEVMAARAIPGGGCCNYHCDNSECLCLSRAMAYDAMMAGAQRQSPRSLPPEKGSQDNKKPETPN